MNTKKDYKAQILANRPMNPGADAIFNAANAIRDRADAALVPYAVRDYIERDFYRAVAVWLATTADEDELTKALEFARAQASGLIERHEII